MGGVENGPLQKLYAAQSRKGVRGYELERPGWRPEEYDRQVVHELYTRAHCATSAWHARYELARRIEVHDLKKSEIAAHMGVSDRTLRRALKGEGRMDMLNLALHVASNLAAAKATYDCAQPAPLPVNPE